MAVEGVRTQLFIQIYDLNGVLIVPELYHLHQVTWNVLAMQKGSQGNQSLGDFTIPLPPALSDEFGQYYSAQYSQIAAGMRVEAYYGNVPAGAPAFTGMVHKINFSADGACEIHGFDWMAVLGAQLGLQGEFTEGATGADLCSNYIGINQYMLLDDFAGHGIQQGAYTIFPASTWVPSLDEGIQTYTIFPGTGSNLIQNNHNFTDAYAPVVVFEAWFHFSPLNGTPAAIIGEMGILAGFDGLGASAQNGWEFRALAVGDGAGPGTYHINAEIVQFVAGTGSVLSTNIAFSGVSGDQHFQVIAIGDARRQPNQYLWRVMVNGKDVSTFVNVNITNPTGYIGARAIGSANSGRMWVAQLKYTLRQIDNKWFKKGNLNTALGPAIGRQPMNGLSFLDMLSLGANIAGGYWRKRPAGGFSGDFIDMDAAPTPGTSTNVGRDLTASVKFEDGRNLLGLDLEANLENLASEIRLSGSTSGVSGGTLNWTSIPNAVSIGVVPGSTANVVALADSVADVGLTDFLLMRRQSENVSALKAQPNQAKTIHLLRTPDVANQFRELDLVELHCPRFGINHQPVLVLGYTFRENDSSMDVLLDQLSWRHQLSLEQERSSNLDVLQQIFGKR